MLKFHHLETRIGFARQQTVVFQLASFPFHDASDLEMIRPGASGMFGRGRSHLHFQRILSRAFSAMQGWYLAWLQDRFLSSVVCKDEVWALGQGVEPPFFRSKKCLAEVRKKHLY